MGIHEDAQNGTLIEATLTRYLQSNRNILNEPDPTTGYLPLATAAVAGSSDVVEQLLQNNANAEALTRNGETTLLLATRYGKKNVARVVQLLLPKTPPRLIDATTPAHDKDTPLMKAVRRKDIEAIRLLAGAGASPTASNARNETPESVAKAAGDSTLDKAVLRALNPKGEKEGLQQIATIVGDFVNYTINWINQRASNIATKIFKLKPKQNPEFAKVANPGQKTDPVQVAAALDNFVSSRPSLTKFFKNDNDFLKRISKNIASLADDPNSVLGQEKNLTKMVEVTMHKQVIYCDDSGSMHRDGRWPAQVLLVKRIAEITTLILPSGDGITLRFINQNPNNADDLSTTALFNLIDKMKYSNGDTPIGTNLRSKILEPMIYNNLARKTLNRPYLISIMTDGDPQPESKNTLIEVIKECRSKLKQAGYPVETVRFLIGQIGTAKAATAFLNQIRDVVEQDDEIKVMVHVLSNQLDDDFSKYKANENELNQWMIETLYKPFTNIARERE